MAKACYEQTIHVLPTLQKKLNTFFIKFLQIDH